MISDTISYYYARPRPQLLADRARDATKPGTCTRCPYGVATGQRVARLATGEWVHAWCASSPSVRTPYGQVRR